MKMRIPAIVITRSDVNVIRMKTTMAGTAMGACRSFLHGAWARFKRPVLAITVLCAAAAAGAAEPPHLIALFPSASSPHWEGFARIINHSDEPGTVRITGIDDAGVEHRPVELSLKARESVHFNSADLEAGSAQKGLSSGLGHGDGDWRLHLSSELDIEPLSYIRTEDGFVTAMHQVVPAEGMRHHVRFFNPGSNASQVSRLRLVNPTEEAVEVTIEGRDDAGEAAPGGAVGLTLAPGQARTLTAQALESDGAGMTGSLGDGTGKWQLLVSARGRLEVMNLLASPTGHLSNLSAPGLRDVAGGKREHELPLFMPASDAVRQGFARIVNHSDEPGTVRITGIDDAGVEHSPVELSLEARASAHFNSADLESGNAGKALSGALGAGTGSWRLRLYTELDIEALAYVRTADGFVTTMHERVRESAMRHHVAFFNPGGNRSQVSRLRLVNPTEEAVEVAIAGRDDAGEPAPGGAVSLTLAPGEARTLSAQALESGGAGMTGSLGDGTGKWQLFVSADGALHVMSLLLSPTGHLSNLSASGKANVVPVAPPPTPRISDASAVEGDSLVFTVMLDRAPAEAVTYYYATYQGTARSEDYVGHDDTALRFGPGERSKTITVRTIEDTGVEDDETFYVYITDAVSKLPDRGLPTDYLARATGTIGDELLTPPPTGHAPADQQAFDRLIVGKRAFFEFTAGPLEGRTVIYHFPSAGRFRTDLGVGFWVTGRTSYTNTGANTGTTRSTYEGQYVSGDICITEYFFTSTTRANFSARCSGSGLIVGGEGVVSL